MSVINETLKSLELRGGRGAMPPPVAVPNVARAARRHLPLPLVLLVGLLLAIVWVWWPTLQRISGSAPVVSHPQAKPITATPERAPEPVAEAPEAAPAQAEVARKADDATPPVSPAQPKTVAPEPQPAVRSEPVTPQRASVPVEPTTTPAAKPEPKPKPKPEPAPVLAIQKSSLSPAEQAHALWQQAQQAAEPESLLVQAIELDPRLHDARLALIALLAQRGEADDVLLDAARRFPEEAAYPLLAAELSQQQGDREVAQQWLTWASRLNPNAEWRARRAALAQKLGQLSLAQQDYQALLDAEPQRGAWWFGLGYARDANGDLSGAATAYQQALNRTDLSPQARAFIRDRLTVLERR